MPNQKKTKFQQLHQQIGNPQSIGRKKERRGKLSPDPVTPDTLFTMQEHTYPDQQGYTTVQESSHFLAGCGCYLSNPNQVKGVCPECTKKVGRSRRPPTLVCSKHSICLACRKAKLREMRGGGKLKKSFRFLFKLILWPFFDVEDENP
jgi:hypothetical protein